VRSPNKGAIINTTYEGAEKEDLDVYMWEVTYDTNENKIVKQEVWLQFTKEEAAKWKADH